MAIVLVQNSATVNTTNGTNTLPASSTTGNLLVSHLDDTGSTPVAPAGWVLGNGSLSHGWIFYYPDNPGGLSSFTFTNGGKIVISEWSGVIKPHTVNTSGTGGGASSPQTVTTSGTISFGDELAVAVVAEVESKGGTTTLGDSFVKILDNGAASTTIHVLASYLIGGTVGSTLSDTASSSSMNLSTLGVAIVVFTSNPMNENFHPIEQPLYDNFPQIISV